MLVDVNSLSTSCARDISKCPWAGEKSPSEVTKVTLRNASDVLIENFDIINLTTVLSRSIGNL